MKAKILTETELEHVLTHIRENPNPTRNRAMLLMTFWAGLTVKDLTALRMGDVMDEMGFILSEITVSGRTVLLSDKLQAELLAWIETIPEPNRAWALFPTQKNPAKGFTENTMTQHFFYIYKNAGIVGASSHSGRRTFVNNLAEKGVDMKVIQGLSGHKSIGSLTSALEKGSMATRKRNALDLL